MSQPISPKPSKLIISVLLHKKTLIRPVVTDLVHEFGKIEIISPWLPFTFTTYYQKEMGAPLFRRLLAFQSLIEQTSLSEIKCQTNCLEKKFSKEGKRQVNIDPGYLLLERFVLASGKNFSHRIYLDRGIYADLTLIYENGLFRKLPWTYPDYAGKEILSFLEIIREKYTQDLDDKFNSNL